MGLNFQYYDGLQPNIRAGIINEHECKLYSETTVESGHNKKTVEVDLIGVVRHLTSTESMFLFMVSNPHVL